MAAGHQLRGGRHAERAALGLDWLCGVLDSGASDTGGCWWGRAEGPYITSGIRSVWPRPRLQRGRNRSRGITTRLQGPALSAPVASRLSSRSANLCSGYPAFLLSEPHGSRRPSTELLPAVSLPTRLGSFRHESPLFVSRLLHLLGFSCQPAGSLPPGMPEPMAWSCVLVDTPAMGRSFGSARLKTSA